MIRPIYIIPFLMSIAIFASCSTKKPVLADEPKMTGLEVEPIAASPVSAMPKAVIYKMNGDYSQLVPITLDASRQRVVSYPAPSDLTDSSTPLAIGNGWYLDRRGGVGPNTAFLKYTYAQYRALPSAPAPSQLLREIVPQARVTVAKALPMTLNAALADTSVLIKYAQ